MELSVLINRFNIKGRLVALQPFGNGNINDTFLAVYRNTFTETQVVLQRINRNVFPEPEAIMANMHAITKHCLLQDDAARAEPEPRARAVPPLRIGGGPRAVDTERAEEAVIAHMRNSPRRSRHSAPRRVS